MSLNPITIRAPGFGGLNLEGQNVETDATFCRIAKNLVFDGKGNLASRKGYANISDLDGTDNVESIFVYDSSSGDSVITSLADHIFEDAADKQGSLAHSTANWQFQNFNDKVVGCQNGQTMIVYNGTGNFAAVTAASGTVPNGNCVHSAFGRLWATDNNATLLKWSALLDETHWTTGAGEANILGNESAVRSGYDRITAIDHIQDKLVVFLENSIVIFSNPDDPSSLGIYKTINNIGCIARDSVQHVGNDLVFMSRDGLRSLVRAIAEDNFPLRDLSRLVRTELIADISGSPQDMKSAYYPEEGMYILLTTESRAWVFDFKRVFEDGLPRVTTWDVPTWHSIYYHEGTLYIGQEGEYGQYSGYQEDGAVYQVEYKSLNIDFDSEQLKIIKKTVANLSGADAQAVSFTYEWEYGETSSTETVSLPSDSGAGIYGTDDYGTAIYGDGVSRAKIQVNPGGSGDILAFGLRTFVQSIKFTIEQMTHYATLGRLSR